MTEITPEFVVKKLNEWLEKDQESVFSWTWEMFTKCNDSIANDDDLVIREFDPELGEEYEGTWLTPLGLLNGILTSAGNTNVVGAQFDSDGKLLNFQVVSQIKKDK